MQCEKGSYSICTAPFLFLSNSTNLSSTLCGRFPFQPWRKLRNSRKMGKPSMMSRKLLGNSCITIKDCVSGFCRISLQIDSLRIKRRRERETTSSGAAPCYFAFSTPIVEVQFQSSIHSFSKVSVLFGLFQRVQRN